MKESDKVMIQALAEQVCVERATTVWGMGPANEKGRFSFHRIAPETEAEKMWSALCASRGRSAQWQTITAPTQAGSLEDPEVPPT